MDQATKAQILAPILGFVLGFLYFVVLAKHSKKNKLFFGTLLVSVVAIIAINSWYDYRVIKAINVGEPNHFSLCVLALSHSIELFIFQTHFFDNGYQEFFFGTGRHPGHPEFLYPFVITSILAAITSISLVIRAFGRKKAGRYWLASHGKEAAHSHVFFYGGEVSVMLAKDISKKHPDQPIIYIGYPDPESLYVDLSVWEKIRHLFKSRSDDDIRPFSAMVFSQIPLSEAKGTDICRQLNLKDLSVFLQTPSCRVYLLSDDEEENLRCADMLYRDGCTAEVFCRACREGINRMYEDTMTKTPSANVHLIDASYLAVRNIKNHPELLPVNYVEKGTDENGQLEGWVKSPFNAMILGFGETGRETLGFLYEYGAFVDKDFKKSPFSCVVMDRMMNNLSQAYQKQFPGMTADNGICFKQCEIGSNEFWNDFSQRIQSLNYIVICMGSDRLNLSTAINIVEFAFRNGKDLSKNFVILIAQNDPSHLDEATLYHYNQIDQYHNCIRSFSNSEDVWTFDNITNESLTARAKKYFAGYMLASGDKRDPGMLWNDREKVIETTDNYALHAKRVRQRAQDYANCFHISTKLALIGPEIYNHRHEIALCIPSDFDADPRHYTGDDEHVEKVLHYLAVHEHIRWEASHIALGYAPGKCTDEVLKTHECIMSYDDLTPKVQHYDYLVVKTTFA